MKKSQVALAASEFAKGNYRAALEIYEKLGHLLGENLFQVNITLCKKRIEVQQNLKVITPKRKNHSNEKPAFKTSLKNYSQHASLKKNEGSNVESYVESFTEILKEAKKIPDSNGSEYFDKYKVKVAIISDEYMYNFYKDIFTDIEYITPDNYQDILKNGIDVFIYTTCWKGISNEEWKGVKFREKPLRALESIIQIADKEGIKTVFQSIEDPSNFDYFLPIAVKFDYVFTTDEDCIPSYKQKLGHERVFFGEYGVNPQFNNPIGCRRNIRNAAFFAGSYPKRYQERCADMEIIFDSIIDSGGDLLIADRNFGTDSQDLQYPNRFKLSVLPPVKHAILQKLHKLFRYNINFNSIKQSPSMCAMRAYELQAQGNGLISNYAKSIFNKFPGVRIIPYKQDLTSEFNQDEKWEEYQRNIANVREVLNDKTAHDVVSKMLSRIGIDSSYKHNNTIAVICAEKTEQVIKSFETQSYPDKVLLFDFEINNWENLIHEYKIGYFCWFSSINQYETNYLNDLVNAFKYTNCDYITKNSYFDSLGRYNQGVEHEYTNKSSGKALSLFSARRLSPKKIADYTADQSFALENGYSIDPFEVNYIKHRQNTKSKFAEYNLSVIVPVYNNGRFLASKCIPSLQRNKTWHEMEILIVDDGSDDNETLTTLSFLEKIYSNVRVKKNNDGGSGSASRPRNQGIDLSTAPLITFLDPDNEIAPSAYDVLLKLYDEANSTPTQKVEFVSGYHLKVSETVKVIGRHTLKELSIVEDFKAGYFERGRFPVIATQSAVIEKRFLNEKNIRFVEKSAGQDTLFGWELIANATCGAFSGLPYIIYYAERNGSITNKVDISYFEKKLILEKAQKSFLDKNKILEVFLNSRFDDFMKDWYIPKYLNISDNTFRESLIILDQICRLYGRKIEDYDEYLKGHYLRLNP